MVGAALPMLGLPGFVLIAVSELEDEIEQAVQTRWIWRGAGVRAVAASDGRQAVRVRGPTGGGSGDHVDLAQTALAV
jgi:hypothetical protein